MATESLHVLNAVVATGDGTWVEFERTKRSTIHIKGITTATVQVRGSNEPTKPADSDHGVSVGSDITADSLVKIDQPMKWIKVRVSAWTSGTINGYLLKELDGPG